MELQQPIGLFLRDVEKAIRYDTSTLSQYQINQICEMAKVIISQHTYLSRKRRRDFALCIVQMLKQRQNSVIRRTEIAAS